MWKAIYQIEEYKTNPWSEVYIIALYMWLLTANHLSNPLPFFSSTLVPLWSKLPWSLALIISNLSAPFLPSTLLPLKFIIHTVHQVIFLKNNTYSIINPWKSYSDSQQEKIKPLSLLSRAFSKSGPNFSPHLQHPSHTHLPAAGSNALFFPITLECPPHSHTTTSYASPQGTPQLPSSSSLFPNEVRPVLSPPPTPQLWVHYTGFVQGCLLTPLFPTSLRRNTWMKQRPMSCSPLGPSSSYTEWMTSICWVNKVCISAESDYFKPLKKAWRALLSTYCVWRLS